MTDSLYPASSPEIAEKRHALAPETEKAFQAFSKQVFAGGALSAKTKQIIAVAVAHVTQCPYGIRGHTKGALRHGARAQELFTPCSIGFPYHSDGRALREDWKNISRDFRAAMKYERDAIAGNR